MESTKAKVIESELELQISIVIVHYRTYELTRACLASIRLNSFFGEYEIVLVDNSSQDGSIAQLKTEFPDVRYILNKKNEGFGRGNNIGIASARGNYIILLNSDTLVPTDFIHKVWTELDACKNKLEPALYGCQLLNEDGTKQKSCFTEVASFRELLTQNLLFDLLARMFNVSLLKSKGIRSLHGACMFFEPAKLKSVGFFDPDFFMYAEEFEWCFRVRKMSGKINFVPSIEIVHAEGGSTTVPAWNLRQRMVSQGLLFLKVRGRLGLILYFFLITLETVTNSLLMHFIDSGYRAAYRRIRRYRIGLIAKHLRLITGQYPKPFRVE